MVDAPGSRAEAANEGLAGSRPESRKGDQGEASAESGAPRVGGVPSGGGVAEGEGEEEEEEEEEEAGENATYNSREVNDQVFEELHLGLASGDVQGSWRDFLGSAESREAAGEAIYAAVFDAAPSLQSLFKTPRAVMAMRFMNGLNQIISSLHDPKALKVVVETLGFQHLDLEVTIPRVIMFRDAIVELLQIELGARMSSRAREGWNTMLNYVGGSYIYVRLRFADRLKILAGSWATANQRQQDELAEEANDGDEKEGEGSHDTDATDPERDDKHGAGQNLLGDHGASGASKSKRRVSMWGFGGKRSTSSSKAGQEASKSMDESGTSKRNFRNASVPTTYNEMFYFNAAVMGFGQSRWMNEVLASFDTIVTNVANSYRLQEECDVLSLRIAKYKGAISLGEYKAVMLASLRSLVPKDWDSNHEVAWSWLWENVERMLKAQMGKPAAQERALEALWGSQDEASQAYLRREVYVKFFTLAPAGQDYFKQSTTRLHFIADRIVSMTLEIYRDPQKMVEDISALGLRHVGYGIPTELFGPFVTACVQVVRTLTVDDVAKEAFRWSLSLISRILTRVITEGSTIVMKAINTNSGKALKRAVGCAPRGKRALWMLNVQVGTQSISPFMWAIETGSLEAAKAIIVDLLTIRADRDRYYYGMDTLFERHPDVVRRLCVDAPELLPTLFDGLVWRSRATEGGMRRVNYYVKHLMVDGEGGFSKTIEWITDNGCPKIVCHPVISMVTDIVWSRIAFKSFMIGKMWLLVTLVVFITGTSCLKHIEGAKGSEFIRCIIFGCRCFIYIFSLGQWLFYHMKHTIMDIRSKNLAQVGCLHVPEHLTDFQDICSFILTICLLLMLGFEPIIQCMPHQNDDFAHNGMFTEMCPQADATRKLHGVIACVATAVYFALAMDLSVLSTRISAFVLVVFRVLSEMRLFLFGLSLVLLSFSCAISSLDHNHSDFESVLVAAGSLMQIAFRLYDTERYSELEHEASLLVAVIVYVIIVVMFLSNLLIAQLNSAYQSTYQDMVGFARLNRGKVVQEAMSFVSERKWQRFLDSLRLDERCEFGEGDIGLAGAIQILEPASANITTVDMIRRFGGSTSPLAQWPEEDAQGEDDDDRMERMERLLDKAIKRMTSSRRGRRDASSSSGQGGSSMWLSAESGSSEHDDDGKPD